jgi:ATP-dependent Clp protease ATP-binding subunit ClpC
LLSFLYNGCSIGNFSRSDEANRAVEFEVEVEPVQRTSREEGFMYERFTQKAIQTIFLAQEESRRLRHAYVGTEQLLLALMGEGSGIAAQVLTAAGVNLETTRLEVEKIIGHGRGTPVEIPFTPRAKRSLELSLEASRQLGHNYIGTEHLLLGIIREHDGLGARVLQIVGVDLQNLEQRLRSALA